MDNINRYTEIPRIHLIKMKFFNPTEDKIKKVLQLSVVKQNVHNQTNRKHMPRMLQSSRRHNIRKRQQSLHKKDLPRTR